MAMLVKPSRLDRLVRKAESRRNVVFWRSEVFKRDGGKCRVCRRSVKKNGATSVLELGQIHHIVYRSAGGSDEPVNLILICAFCHEDEHRHLISITGTAGRLKIVRNQ